jgi:hypothetical protein
MSARIAALQDGVDRQLIDARADLMVASADGRPDVVASAKDYVDEVRRCSRVSRRGMWPR